MDYFKRTKSALKAIENVFRCDLCFETCPSLFKVAKCPDYFCQSCAEDNVCCCPICKVRSRASDVHTDPLTTVLSEEFTKLRTLIGEAEEFLEPGNWKDCSIAQREGLITEKETAISEKSLTDANANDKIKSQLSKSAVLATTSTSIRNLANVKTYATAKNRSCIRKKLQRNSGNSKSPSKAPVPERTVNETVNAAVDASDKLQADITALIRGQTKHQCQEMVRKPVKGRVQFKKVSSTVQSNTSSPTVNNLSNVRKRDKLGNSRLQLSCTSKCEDSALDDVRRFLFEDGINPNERDNNNWTPLHEAACRGHNKIVELLLKSGAVVDAVGGEGCITPLHDAIINGHLETVRILLNFGASTIQRNSQGATSFDMTSDENILSLLYHYRDNPVVQRTPVLNIPNRKDLCLCFTTAARERYSAIVVNLAALNLMTINFKNEICQKVTHFIVTDRTCRRTLKFFAALTLGKWIVTGDWLQECYKKRQLVPESAYEVIGTNYDPVACGPRLWRENNLRLLPPLFASIHVYCRNLNPNWDKDFKKILQYAGAKFVSREPRSDADLRSMYNTVLFHSDPDSPESKVNFLIMYDSENEHQMKKDAQENGLINKCAVPKRLNTERIKTVSTFWFFGCLQSFKILPFPDSDPLSDLSDD